MNKAEAIEALRDIDVPEITLMGWAYDLNCTAEQLVALYKGLVKARTIYAVHQALGGGGLKA